MLTRGLLFLIEETLANGWDNYVARTVGPLSFRFLLQPAMAVFLAIRAGVKDAREGRPPFLWAIVTRHGVRGALFRETLRDTTIVLCVAAILDSVYQVVSHQRIYALELLFTAVTLAYVPYLLVRGPANRIASWARRMSGGSHNEPRPRP